MNKISPDRRLADVPRERRTVAAFLNSGDYASIYFDIGGVIIDWNGAAEKLLGWSEQDVAGRSIAIIFTPEDIASGIPEKERALAARHGVTSDERWHIRRDGSTFWASGQVTALYENHEIIGFAKILRDRTRERTTEERLKIAQQAGGLGTFEYYPESDHVVTSQQFCHLWNIPAQDQYSASYLSQFLHPEDRGDFFSLDEPNVECRLLLPGEHSPRWIARRGKALRSNLKLPPRFAGACYDISDLKRAENELREANSRLLAREARFRQLAEFAPGITWLSDPAGNLTYLNNQWQKFSGQTIEEALQDGWATTLHPSDVPKVLTAWNAALKRGNHYEVEARFRRMDGMYRWYLIRAEAFHDTDGNVVGWFGSSVDIHDRMLAEATLRLTERRQNMLLSFDDAIRAYTEPADIQRASCSFLVSCLNVSVTGYGKVDHENGKVSFDAWTGGEYAFRQADIDAEAVVPGGVGTLNSGRTYVSEHYLPRAEPNNAPDSEANRLETMPARVVVPFVHNMVASSLLFIGDTSRAWETDDVALIEELARKISSAMERAHSAKELERRVQELAMERDQLWMTSPDLLVVLELSGRILSANPAVKAILDWTPEEITRKNLTDLIHPDDLGRAYEEIARHVEPGYLTRRFEIRCKHRSGAYRWLNWTASSVQGRIFATARDITDIKAQAEALFQAEESLRQSQKMEAVGRLTGGIAHDFNNHLQGITGSLELIKHLLQTGRTIGIEKYVELATNAVQKAGALTHRLLAFSRRQPLAPRPTDVNKLAQSLEHLLQSTMGKTIEVVIEHHDRTWLALADSNQLENALINLAINARDAMPHGGTLTIGVENAVYDSKAACPQPFIEPGAYIIITVADEGIGMSKDILAHVFEPFFTTKPIGKGTGLGLSMVYGFVKQSNGAVTIDSEPDAGTTVRLFLPRYLGNDDVGMEGKDRGTLRDAEKEKTIVVVEDDAVVRNVICDALVELKYHVLAASTGMDGLEILDAAGRVDLLVTDVALPDITGIELVDTVKGARPNLKVLFMTGYAEAAAEGSEFLQPGNKLITKPFTLQDLVVRLQRILS